MTLMEELLSKGYIDDALDDSVEKATADYIIRLFTYCAKADGSISAAERDYIVNYIEKFDLNESEETWLFAQYDYGKFNDYNIDVITSLKRSIGHLLDKKNLDYKILYHMFMIFFKDNDDMTKEQHQIAKDYMKVFNLDLDNCSKVFDRAKKATTKIPRKHKDNDLDEYYKILGLDKNCTEHDLKKRYACLTKSYHPDKYNSENMPSEIKKELEDNYKKINLAYDKIKQTF